MTPRDIESLFLARVPELASSVARVRQKWAEATSDDSIDPDQFLGDALVPFVEDQLQSAQRGDTGRVLKTISDLLEELLADDNDAVRTAIEVSFLETLHSRGRAVVDRATSYLGPRAQTSLRSCDAS